MSPHSENVTKCPECGRNLIIDEVGDHLCSQDPHDKITKLDFFDLPLMINVGAKEHIMAETPDGRLYVMVFHKPRKVPRPA